MVKAKGETMRRLYRIAAPGKPGSRRKHVAILTLIKLSIGRRSVAMQTLYRGRLIDHVQLVVRDLEASRRFYAAVLKVLGIPIDFEADGMFGADELAISTADSEGAQGRLTGPTHLAFQAADRAMVDAFYAAGLAAGGKDNGGPGERPYHPGYYAAFLRDPDGNNIEAVFHGEAERSTPAVEIRFAPPGQG
jgi:catechol 2,3-dioxygenase-like lactoylglutathione lyase family enzyme